MEKDTILLELSADQRRVLLDHCLTLEDDLIKRFTIALKKGNFYQVQLSSEQIELTINALCEQFNNSKNKKIKKQLDKLIDHLEDINDEFFENVIMKDLSEITGLAPDTIMDMAEGVAEQLLSDPDFEDEDFDKYSQNKGKVIVLKVFLAGTKEIWRSIAIRQGQTLHDLHNVIFDAFDRYDEHMYTFFIPDRKISKFDPRAIHNNSQKYSHPYICDDELAEAMSAFFSDEKDINAAKTQLKDLQLEPGQKFFYLFDFGDEWWHEIKVEDICDPNNGKYPRIIQSKGQSPNQYLGEKDE